MIYHVHIRRKLLFIFGGIFMFCILNLICKIKQSKDRQFSLENLLAKETLKLNKLKVRNTKLDTSIISSPCNDKNKPSVNYEANRRILRSSLDAFWYSIKTKLDAVIENKATDLQSISKKLIISGSKGHNTLLATLDRITEADGFQKWREKEYRGLSLLVQKRLSSLQNPKSCSSTQKLICNLSIDCGFGCQLHHVVYCLIVAYGTNRMLLLDTENWNYGKGAFQKMFEPLSKTCNLPKKYSFQKISNRFPRKKDGFFQRQKGIESNINWWPGEKNDEFVRLPRMRDMKEKPEFLPPSIPKDIFKRILRLHGDPIVWLIGQFLKYILRPTKSTKKYLKSAKQSSSEYGHQVGIHIRRTDKLEKEANFYSVEQYMESVEEYFQYYDIRYGNHSNLKQIYIASDDPEVFLECRKNYPQYKFLGDVSRARSAATSSRYNNNSLQKLFLDVYMLSLSDFIVCTFSSNLCRIAYEIQQQRSSGDNHWRFKSLDDMWQFNIKWDTVVEHYQEVILPHFSNRPGEMSLKVGDILNIESNLWDGYGKGKSVNNRKSGLYPLYKTKEKLKAVDFTFN